MQSWSIIYVCALLINFIWWFLLIRIYKQEIIGMSSYTTYNNRKETSPMTIHNNWLQERKAQLPPSPSTSSWSSMNQTRHKSNPRQQCCWEGQYFFDALKAIGTRIIFLAHAFLAVWRVTLVSHLGYWLFSLSFIGMLVETIVILLKRRGQEWSW